jgi:hypothetical protein
MRLSTWIRLTLFGLLAVSLLLAPTTNATSTTISRLSSRLQLLSQPALQSADPAQQSASLNLPRRGPGSLFTDPTGRILTYVRVTSTEQTTLNALRSGGAQIAHVAPAYQTVTAWVAPSDLLSIAGLPMVISVREELRPRMSTWQAAPSTTLQSQTAQNCGLVTSEGDTQLRAREARETFGVSGTGVTVGILSDSFNQDSNALTTAEQDIASGDLPGAGNPCNRGVPVQIIAPFVGDLSDVIDEGRAMAQIVHDLAPGARILFHTAFFNTSSAAAGIFAYADGVRLLQQNGAKIIVDDVSYFAEPMFQDGPVNVAINTVTGAGVSYFTAGGNSNLQLNGSDVGSYESPALRPTTCPNSVRTRQPQAICHDFDPSTVADNRSQLTLAPFGEAFIVLQWAEPWFGVSTDLNLYVLDSNDRIVAGDLDANTELPFAAVNIINLNRTAQNFTLVISAPQGSGTPRLKYVNFGTSATVTNVEYNQSRSPDIVGPTITDHAAADQAVSIAAIPFNNGGAIEDFSSRGPAVHYFGPVLNSTPAAPLASPKLLNKPDLAATNGGLNTFFGEPNCAITQSCRFFGTSAAAPHAAAVAALIVEYAARQGLPSDPFSVRTALLRSAQPIAGFGGSAAGAGRVDAVAAIQALRPPNKIFAPIMLR